MNKKTRISELFYEYLCLNESKWAIKNYYRNERIIEHYLLPALHDDILVRNVDKAWASNYFENLKCIEGVGRNGATNKPITIDTLCKCMSIIKGAFELACLNNLILENPFKHIVIKGRKRKSDFTPWNEDIFLEVLYEEYMSKLGIVLLFMLFCDLSVSEVLALKNNDLHIGVLDQIDDHCFVTSNYKLARFNSKCMTNTRIIENYGTVNVDTYTSLVLIPKTSAKELKCYFPKAILNYLKNWQKHQNKLLKINNSKNKWDFLIALESGRPCEDRVIAKEFKKNIVAQRKNLRLSGVLSFRKKLSDSELKLFALKVEETMKQAEENSLKKLNNKEYLYPDLKNIKIDKEESDIDIMAALEFIIKNEELKNRMAKLF